MKRLALCVLALVISLCATSGSRLTAVQFFPATVTFSDRDGDNITSDYLTTGNHSYTNSGSAKLEVGFYAGTNDLVLKQLLGPLPRSLNFSLMPITPSGAPMGALTERNIFMNIRNILTLLDGQTTNAIAIFGTSFGQLKLTPNWIDTSLYATKVYVYRIGKVWTVRADPGLEPGEPGDVAVITKTKGNTEQAIGLYHVPFQVTATCPTCP